MQWLMDYLCLFYDLMTYQITYDEFSEKVREDRFFYPQAAFLLVFLLISLGVTRFPLFAFIVLPLALISALYLQKTAYSRGQQLFRGFLWAVSWFVISALALFLIVSFGGYPVFLEPLW